MAAADPFHDHPTDYEILLQVRQMEALGYTRKRQAQSLGKSEAWISESRKLPAATPKILESMAKGILHL